MTFLENYLIYTSGNECPELFHRWGGLSALSSLISKRVWMPQGDAFTVYPQMYVLLVANPGIKKSTAMRFSRRLVGDIGTIPIAPTSISKEALTAFLADKKGPCRKTFTDGETLKRYTHLSIYANELISFLAIGGRPEVMIDFLTEIWDSNIVTTETKKGGKEIIEDPFLTILGCMTPQKMAQLMFEKIISGGFTRRCVFIFADKNKEPVPIVIETDEQREARAACVERGKALQKISGEFQWSPDGKDYYIDWYKQNFYQCQNANDDLVYQEFLRTKPEYALKVAMLLSLSENDELILEKIYLRTAVAYLTEIEPGYRAIFAGSGRNDVGAIQAQFESMVLDSSEPLMKKRILTQFRKEAKLEELEGILNHLTQAGVIEKTAVKKGSTIVTLYQKPTK
jgi:hypothetical protein